MSRKRVDRLLNAYEALNRGDFDAVSANLRDDFEFIPPPMLLETGVFKGPDGLRRLWETYTETFADFRAEVEEVIEAGDRVIVMAAVAGTGGDSGLAVRTPSFAWVWTFDGDTAVRMEAMPNRATALEAVGISE